MHLALSDGPKHAFDRLRNWCTLGPEELWVISDPSVMPGVLNRLLRSVAVVATGHHTSGSPLPLQPRYVMHALQYADGGDWWEPIAFLDLLVQQSWTDQFDVSVISPLLTTSASRAGKTFSVGYWVAVEAFKPQGAELLYSRGPRVHEAALAERDNDFTVVVTEGPYPVMGLRGNVGLVLPVSEIAAGAAQVMQDIATACVSAGQPVLVLRVQSGEKVRSETARWSADWLRSGLLRRRESR